MQWESRDGPTGRYARYQEGYRALLFRLSSTQLSGGERGRTEPGADVRCLLSTGLGTSWSLGDRRGRTLSSTTVSLLSGNSPDLLGVGESISEYDIVLMSVFLMDMNDFESTSCGARSPGSTFHAFENLCLAYDDRHERGLLRCTCLGFPQWLPQSSWKAGPHGERG